MMGPMTLTASTPRPNIHEPGANQEKNEVTAMIANRTMTQTDAMRSRMRNGFLLLAGLALAGCAQPMMRTPNAETPVAAPVAAPAPRVVTPVIQPVVTAPVQQPAPAPVASGPVDARSGLHQAAVVSIAGSADSRFTVLFRPSLTEASRVNAAPAQLCRQAGRDLKTSRTNKPGASSAMPGVQVMIVECNAA